MLVLRNFIKHTKTKLFGDSGEEERMKRQTSVLGIIPGPSDWEFSAPSTKPLRYHSKVCLPILPYMLPVFVDYSVNIPLTDHLNDGSLSLQFFLFTWVTKKLCLSITRCAYAPYGKHNAVSIMLCHTSTVLLNCEVAQYQHRFVLKDMSGGRYGNKPSEKFTQPHVASLRVLYLPILDYR